MNLPDDDKPPEVLTVAEITRLLAAAKRFKAGKLAPYVAVAVFGGLRQGEIFRLPWGQVNLADGELTLAGTQTKTGRGRCIELGEPLEAWLRWCDAHGQRSFTSPNFQREFAALRRKAKLGRWCDDIVRHSAISFFFRREGSYGRAAERFGNSEGVIKRHYQGRVSSADAERFFLLFPTHAEREAAREAAGNIVAMPAANRGVGRKAGAQ